MVSRTRSRGGFFNYATKCTQWVKDRNCSDAIDVKLGEYFTCKVGSYQKTTDVVVKNFELRRSRGEVFFNPYTSSRQDSFVDQDGNGPAYQTVAKSCSSPVKYQTGHYDGPWLAALVAPDLTVPVVKCVSESDISSLQREISTKVLANRGKSSNNLFESLAEYKQTLSMLNGPIKSLYRIFGKMEGTVRVMRPDEAWLVFRYGIKPAVNDIQGIISGMKQVTGKKRESTRAKGEILGHDTAYSQYTNFAGLTINTKVQNVISDSVHVSAVSLDEYVATLGSNIGFTTKGLITVPWELLSYSFVYDWFVNLGEFLSAFAPAPGYQQLGSCLVTQREIENVYTVSELTYNAGYITLTRGWDGELRSRLITKTRTPLAPAGLVIRNDFKLVGNAIRQADAVALLSQRLLKLFGDPALLITQKKTGPAVRFRRSRG